MKITEADILHETENLYLLQTKAGLEILLTGRTHAVIVGKPTQGIERAKKTMERLERYPKNLRTFMNHY